MFDLEYSLDWIPLGFKALHAWFHDRGAILALVTVIKKSNFNSLIYFLSVIWVKGLYF